MNQEDKKRFIQIMLGMADNFRDTLTKPGIDMRFEILSQYTLMQIEAAAKKILFTRKYTKMPPVAEFIEAIEGGSKKELLQDQAEIQANYVISCIGQDQPVFSDPITAHLMSKRWPWWTWARNVLESEIQWWAKEFKTAYIAFKAAPNVQIECGPEMKKLIEPIGRI